MLPESQEPALPCSCCVTALASSSSGVLLFEESLIRASCGELGVDFIKRDGCISDLKCQWGSLKGTPRAAGAGGHGVQSSLPNLGVFLHFHP